MGSTGISFKDVLWRPSRWDISRREISNRAEGRQGGNNYERVALPPIAPALGFPVSSAGFSDNPARPSWISGAGDKRCTGEKSPK